MTEHGLSKKSPFFRYFFYIFSSFRPVSFRNWKANGEPNPFVTPSYKKREQTERVEFIDIFSEDLSRSGGRTKGR